MLGYFSGKKKEPVNYSSIVTDLFDGTIQSSVQCLTCHRVRYSFLFIQCVNVEEWTISLVCAQ